MAKLGFETKVASQKTKGAPRAGNASDRGELPTSATRSYETHPAKGKDVGKGTEPVVGKLGS